MKITVNEIKSILDIAYETKMNVFISGQPGIGKTTSITEFAEARREANPNFQFHTFYAPTMTPIDIQATMPDMATGKLRFFNNEALPNAYTDPDAEGLIFFGELPNADPTVVKTLQKYVRGEDINGCLQKPANMRIVVDGNRMKDRSGVLQQSRAFLSSFLHVEVTPVADDEIQYAIANKWHPNVIAFLKSSPHLIDKYDEEFDKEISEEARCGIWASMRSWSRVSAVEWYAENNKVSVPSAFISGNVGMATALQYKTYCEVLQRLASLEQVLAAPDKVDIPSELSELHALASMVALRVRAEDVSTALVFFRRLPIELQVISVRLMMMNPTLKPTLLKMKEFLEFITSAEMDQVFA